MHTNVQLFQKFFYFSFTFPACPCPPITAQRCHYETSPQTGRGNPRPLASLCEAAQCSHWVVRRSIAEVATRSVDGGIVVPLVLASLCEGGVMAFGHDGGRDDFRLYLRKTIRRGGALPLPPVLHNASGGVEPRPHTPSIDHPLLRGCFQRGRAATLPLSSFQE